MKPRLFIGSVTDRVYLSRRYRLHANGQVEAITKTDVTEEFENACLAYLARLAGGDEGHKFLADGLDALVAKVNARVEEEA